MGQERKIRICILGLQGSTGHFLAFREVRNWPGGGGTWVNFCLVCAAGLSEPLTHNSLFCGEILDPILVTFGKM